MLDSLLVLDLSAYLPGPYLTQTLADFGARVVKVEPPGGDPARHVPPHDEEGVSAAFRALNHGKRSLGLDLKQSAARDLLLRLVEQADVLVEGFRPGVLERLGVGSASCRERNPRLIWCSVSGYGQDGPAAATAGHDINYLASSGALSITTCREGHPAVPGLQVADALAALAGLSGVLLALCERERSGLGRMVDASMLDAAVSVQGLHFAAQALGASAAPRAMPLNGVFPCYDLYPTADGRAFALGALEPKFWARFCDVVGRPEWVARQFDPSLRDEVAGLFAERTRDEWRVVLETAGCCGSPVLDYSEVREDPQVRARGLLEEARAAPPVRFSPSLRRPAAAVPARVGADSRAVLSEFLNLDSASVDALVESGAVVA